VFGGYHSARHASMDATGIPNLRLSSWLHTVLVRQPAGAGRWGLACLAKRHPSGAIPAARLFLWLQPLLRAGRIERPHPYRLAGDLGRHHTRIVVAEPGEGSSAILGSPPTFPLVSVASRRARSISADNCGLASHKDATAFAWHGFAETRAAVAHKHHERRGSPTLVVHCYRKRR